MKAFFAPLLFLVAGLALVSCSDTPVEELPEPIGGRDPEVAIFISGETWIPATIGFQVFEMGDGSGTVINLRTGSRSDRGFRRELGMGIRDGNIEWPISDTLDLLMNEHPTSVSIRYELFTNGSNTESNYWIGQRPDLGGLKIYSITEEDGVTYASGEFFMNPIRDDLNPRRFEITALFNNVRVFGDANDMQEYFRRVNELLTAQD